MIRENSKQKSTNNQSKPPSDNGDSSQQKLKQLTLSEQLRLEGNWTRVDNELIEAPGIPGQAKFLWICLYKFAFKKDTVWPKMETLATYMNCSPNTVRKYRNDLEDIGLIRTKRRGQGEPNLYILQSPREVDLIRKLCGSRSAKFAGLDPQDLRTKKTNKSKKTYHKNVQGQVEEVFDHWNKQEQLVTHQKINTHISSIKTRLKDGFTVQQLKKAISNLNRAIAREDSWYNVSSWTLKDFLSKDQGAKVEVFLEGVEQFVDQSGKKKGNGSGSSRPPEKVKLCKACGEPLGTEEIEGMHPECYKEYE